ncbi:zinc knuckle (CCHC-type) family protein [Abeliophyllum distichum]|uniref:Zinc knuckle (CCHC-type) family protein n=1 Tax=Abeliophyllum distichum TaxID=126358 RepID=A0ABD1RPP4_9LAMI
MNTNDEDVDLGLDLGSTSTHIRSRLNSSSGAGVNANLSGDTAFAASDPLSELVWLPHKGLSLKCADSSSADKKPFLSWNVGPSSKVLSPSSIIRSLGPKDDSVINVGRSTVSQTLLNADSKVDDRATSASPLRSSHIPMLDGNCGHYEEQDVLMRGNGDCKSDMPISGQYASHIIRKTCSNQNGRTENIASGNEIMHLDVAIGSEPRLAKLSESLLGSPPNIQSAQKPDNEVTSATREVNMDNIKMLDLIGAPPLGKLECTAENDLYHPTAKEARTSSEERLPRCNSLSEEKSPTRSRIRLYQEKGKEKVLSDGDDNGRSTDDDEDRHESAESCNSAGLFSKGIKRSKCDQELMVESKRMKKQNQGTHASTYIVNHDSSFMNWISNMVKGVQHFNKEEGSSLALTLAHSNDFDHQETITLDKTHDSKSQNMGFQAMFQSLYCSNTKIPYSGLLKENYSIGESKDHMVADETFLENRTRSCNADKDMSCKHNAISNEEVNLPISRNIVGLSIDVSCETNTAGNKASHDWAIERERDAISSSGSLCKQVGSTAENTSLNTPLEGKAISTMPHKSNPLASLWITRLSVKTPELENCNRSTDQVLGCSTDCTRVNPNTQTGAAIDTQIGATFPIYRESYKEMKNFAASGEASVSIKSINKLNPILPTPKFESSEAMACVFARRLDALRHITPSDKTKSSTCTSTPCFFCGKIGHNLHECPEVTETEFKDLTRNISLFDRVEESRCFCIRCSQLDHWAITCPLSSSSGHCQLEQSASFINHSSRHLMFCSGKEKFSSYLGREEDLSLGREEDLSQMAIDQKAHSFRKLCSDYAPSNQSLDVKEFLGKRIYEVKKKIASNSENNIKEDQSSPLCKVLSLQNEDAPVEMFHALRKLRLSRVDILRCMNSPISQLHLNGFFLRLRLGKWTDQLNKDESRPAELGGTGYYVACITGAQRENLGSSSKSSIFADVEGIKLSVESQYVSNHDFSEDEVKAWWCRIVKTGGKIPSLDELNSKIKERKILGF